MLTITKENNSIKVVGQNNPTYPYSGTLIYPLNSVTVVTDQSNMAVFRSSLNNDVLFTGLIDDITIAGSPVTKEDIGNKFGAISNSSSYATKAELETKLDTSTYNEEKATFALKTEIPDVSTLATKTELSEGLAGKANTSDLSNYLTTANAQSTYATKSELEAMIGQISTKLDEINGETIQ